MRDLIRPALFIIARTALSLAVLAWIVGQWQEAKCCIPISSRQFNFGNCARGWKFEHQDFRQSPGFTFGGVREPDSADSLRFGEDFEITMDQLDGGAVGSMPAAVSLNVAGVVAGEIWGQWFLTIRHWLAITLCMTFNIVLHFVYRKRPETQSCKS